MFKQNKSPKLTFRIKEHRYRKYRIHYYTLLKIINHSLIHFSLQNPNKMLKVFATRITFLKINLKDFGLVNQIMLIQVWKIILREHSTFHSQFVKYCISLFFTRGMKTVPYTYGCLTCIISSGNHIHVKV